ncbi:phosphatidate cytidylyltransferase [Candidatus Xenohaliotis californiensis]
MHIVNKNNTKNMENNSNKASINDEDELLVDDENSVVNHIQDEQQSTTSSKSIKNTNNKIFAQKKLLQIKQHYHNQMKKNVSSDLTKRSFSAMIMIILVILALIQKNFFFTVLILVLTDQALNEARCAISNSYNPNAKPHFIKSYTCWRFIIITTFVSIVFIRHSTSGAINLLWLLISIAAIDTSAYFIGKNFGNKKILPNISPNKTYAGLTAGWIAALLVGLFFYGIKDNIGIIKICTIQTVMLILAQFGDFYESTFKRLCNIKDTGKLLPGHGGILDRIDGFLFTSMFMAAMILLKII